jgi:hypothetical protein
LFFNCYYFVASGLFSNTNFFLQNNPSLRFFIRCQFLQNKLSYLFLLFSTSTFIVTFLLSIKTPKVKMDIMLIVIRGSRKPLT